MQNILYEGWYKYSILKIYHLEWNFGFQFWWKFRWTFKSRFLVEISKILEQFRCNYSFLIKNNLKKIAVLHRKYSHGLFLFLIFHSWFFVVCLFLEHYKWILCQRILGKFLKIKFKKNFTKNIPWKRVFIRMEILLQD